MEISKVYKEFKMIGLKGTGKYTKFGRDVPLLAQKLMSRSNEIKHHLGTEIALFEPKQGSSHVIGTFYVGLLVEHSTDEVPDGMERVETKKQYVTTKGYISDIGNLHQSLVSWIELQGLKRDITSFIVETYHPREGQEEEVHIYLPVI
ncbi:AraC family transcriptional regulator [Bacillus sp. BGMRC 2118]|nr:AraC family transcriptional regulator [Bacillus sp. BGMRC 2118]